MTWAVDSIAADFDRLHLATYEFGEHSLILNSWMGIPDVAFNDKCGTFGEVHWINPIEVNSWNAKQINLSQ